MPQPSLEEKAACSSTPGDWPPPQQRSLPSPSRRDKQPSDTFAVLPRKGILLRWQRERLGLAVAAAWFGFCTFFQICVILPFCSEGQTLTCCMLSEAEIHD